MRDYYKILEVSQNASQEEIKKAYRRLAFLYHPDRNNSPHAQSLIQEINLAYDVIGDVKKREIYNRRLNSYRSYQTTSSPTQYRRTTNPAPRKRPVKSKRFGFEERAMKGKFISAFILFYCFLLCADYFFSSVYKNTVIQKMDVEAHRGKRSTSHYTFHIQSSKVNFEMASEAHVFNINDTLDVDITPFFGIVKRCDQIVDKTPSEMRFLISFYSPVIFLIFMLMGTCIGAIFTKSAEVSYNLSAGNIIFFVIISLIRWLI
jgi:curved DNA-binding protein CbpA